MYTAKTNDILSTFGLLRPITALFSFIKSKRNLYIPALRLNTNNVKNSIKHRSVKVHLSIDIILYPGQRCTRKDDNFQCPVITEMFNSYM